MEVVGIDLATVEISLYKQDELNASSLWEAHRARFPCRRYVSSDW
jgi:hypothetical protein